MKKSARAQGRAEQRRTSLDFRHGPQPRITRVFQNPRHASTMEQVSDGGTGGDGFGRGAKCVVVEVKSLLRHIFQR